MIRLHTFGLWIALLLPALTRAQQYPAAAIPDSLLSDAREVVRHESVLFEVESPAKGKLTVRRVVTIVNSRSEANRVVLFYDGDTRVRKLEAVLYDKNGAEVRKTNKSDVQDFSAISDFSIYEDSRVQVLKLTHGEYPHTIAFEYELDLQGLQFVTYPNWEIQDFHNSVEFGRFAVEMPEELTFSYQTINIDLEPMVHAEKNRKRYTWTVRNLPALRSEPFGPPPSAVLPRLLTSPGQFEIEGYRGSMADWPSYSAFVHRLYEGRDALPAEVAAEVQTLIAGAGSDQEIIERLYRYLQQNVRYVSVQLGIGGWQPFDAEYVSRNKYGDCKALTNYMKALLAEAGVEARPALIYNGDLDYEVTEDFTTPRFNHVILHVPSAGYWLECTSNHYPPGYLGSGNAGRNTLIVDAEKGRLLPTPLLTAEDNLREQSIDITLKAEGGATVATAGRYRGSKHELLRYLHHNFSRDEQKKWFLRNSPLSIGEVNQLTFHASADEPESRMDYSVGVSKYASRAGTRLFAPLFEAVASPAVPEELGTRRYPVVQRKAYTERDSVWLQLPEDYRVESIAGQATDLQTPYGRYQLELQPGDGRLLAVRTLLVHAGEWPPEAYAGFREFFKTVAKLDRTQVVLVKKRT